jgi:hypothetical protein
VAIATSLAFHLLLLALLFSSERAAAPRTETVSFDIELRPAPSAVASVEPAAPTRRPAGSGRAGARSSPTPRAFSPKSRVTGETPGTALDGLRALGLGGAPDLRVPWHDDIPDAGGGTVDHARGAEGPRGEGVAKATGPAALDAWLREQAGRDRVENGLVHPYYRDVGRVLLGAWKAERAIEGRGFKGRLAQLGDNVVSFGRVWQKTAEGYGKSGMPGLIDGGSERVKQLAALPPGPAADALVGGEVERQLRAEFSRGHLTLVRVTQALDGKLLSVELVSPSNDAEIDRAAVAGVRAAAESLPVPPDEAREGRERLVSLWEFALEVSITPPVPVVGIEWDEVRGVTDVRLPLDRRIWKRVRLVALI